MCRGNEQRQIFVDNKDRNRFLSFLVESSKIDNVILYAYVMMPNHFHLLLQTIKANLAEFMRRFNICYTGWFNYHHNRCGHLYQGRYKALLIDADNYLLEVSRYLHLNIVRSSRSPSKLYQRSWKYLEMYQWSSLPGYLNKKFVNNFLDYDFILSMVGGRRKYRDFVLDGLRHGTRNPFEELKGRVILGSDDFVSKVMNEYITDGSVREQPSYRSLVADELEPEAIINCVANALAIDKKKLLIRLSDGVARGIVSDMLYRFSELKQVEIGKLLGNIDYSAVSQLRRRLKKKMEQNKKIMSLYEKAEGKVRELLSSARI